MFKIPGSIKIGITDYVVKYIDRIAEDQPWGVIDFNKAEIRICSDLPAGSKVSTFVHEIVHGMIWNNGINVTKEIFTVVDADEYLCKQFEAGLAQVIDQIVEFNFIDKMNPKQ